MPLRIVETIVSAQIPDAPEHLFFAIGKMFLEPMFK
jgi:hypothetical protein